MDALADPAWSVVIPAYQYPTGLTRCLEALARQRVSFSFEVIVVDDGSAQPLEPLVRPQAVLPHLKFIRVPNGGPGRARNIGARAAAAPWVAFTDHDCLPHPGWLAALHRASASAPQAILGGPVRNALPDNPFCEAHEILSAFVVREFGGHPGQAFFTTNNLAVPRLSFLDIGGFDEHLSFAHEDRELCARWQDRQLPILFADDAAVDHCHSFTFFSFCRQHARYGRSAVAYYRSRRIKAPAAPGLSGLLLYARMLSEPFKTLTLLHALRCAPLLALSQSIYGGAYYLERLRSSRSVPSS